MAASDAREHERGHAYICISFVTFCCVFYNLHNFQKLVATSYVNIGKTREIDFGSKVNSSLTKKLATWNLGMSC